MRDESRSSQNGLHEIVNERREDSVQRSSFATQAKTGLKWATVRAADSSCLRFAWRRNDKRWRGVRFEGGLGLRGIACARTRKMGDPARVPCSQEGVDITTKEGVVQATKHHSSG